VQSRSTPVVEFLSSLGYSQEQLRQVILRFPHVLGYDAKGHLIPHCHYLKSLGLTDEELSRLILLRPHVLVSTHSAWFVEKSLCKSKRIR
jgi:structural maintenance of chromosome 2